MNTSISFQNSNIDWVGSIPSSWEMKKGKYLFSNKKEINSENQCDNLLSLTLFGVLNKDMESSEGLRPLNYKTYQIFEKNDMVFKLIDLENKKTSRVGLVHEKGIMSPVYIRLIPKENCLPKYFYYQYYDLYKKYIFNYLGSGVRSSLNPTDLMEIPLVLPPLPEQKQIVSFLDIKTQKIDELIEKTEQKIELLKEKRTSLINHCVTKGLNPNVEMKDSGVEWIGDIPSHWIKKKLGYSIETIVPMRDKPTSLKGEIPWIRIEDYIGKYIYGSKSNQGVTTELIDEMNLKVYPVNTVLTTCSCSFGTSMIVKKPMTSNQTFIGLVPDENDLNEEFLYYQLKIWENELDRLSSGSIQKYLSRDNFKSLRFIFPPLTEQIKIVEYLDKQTQKIDSTIEKETQRIELLKEYRQSLISEVVTGKIDVMEWKE